MEAVVTGAPQAAAVAHSLTREHVSAVGPWREGLRKGRSYERARK